MGFMKKIAPYALGGVVGGALMKGKNPLAAAASPAMSLISGGGKKKEPESMLNSGGKPRGSSSKSMLY